MPPAVFCRLNNFALIIPISKSKLAHVANLMSCAFQRVVDTFKIESLIDLQREALEKLINGQDVFVI